MITQLNKATLPSDVAVVVASCDAYGDLWPHLFFSFHKYWSDCPFPCYLVTNQRDFNVAGCTVVKVGPDRSWSANLKKALRDIRENRILLWIDDLLLSEPVSTADVLNACKAFSAARANCLKLVPTVPPDRKFSRCFGEVTPGSPYRVSTVATLWEKNILVELLNDTENAWQFELNGTRRSFSIDGFYSVHRSRFSICNAVIKGKWRRAALRKIMHTGIAHAVERPVMTRVEEAQYDLRALRFRVFACLPSSLRKITWRLAGKS